MSRSPSPARPAARGVAVAPSDEHAALLLAVLLLYVVCAPPFRAPLPGQAALRLHTVPPCQQGLYRRARGSIVQVYQSWADGASLRDKIPGRAAQCPAVNSWEQVSDDNARPPPASAQPLTSLR